MLSWVLVVLPNCDRVVALTCLQSKVMLRIEEPSSDFVRLLVRTVVLPDPGSASPPQPQLPAPNASSLADGSSTDGGDSAALHEAPPAPQAADDSSDHPAVAAADPQPEVAVQHSQARVLSPAAVDALLSPASGCEVLLQEESRWLVVSETCSPGGICRWGRWHTLL